MTDVDDIRRRFASLADEDLFRLALSEASDLRPEALALLRVELEKRGASAPVQRAVDAQATELTPDAHRDLMNRFRQLACPLCQRSEQPLNALPVAQIRSTLLRSRYERSIVVGCPSCIIATTREAMETSERVGWWIFSPIGIYLYYKARRTNLRTSSVANQPDPTIELFEFVGKNRGYVALEVGRNAS